MCVLSYKKIHRFCFLSFIKKKKTLIFILDECYLLLLLSYSTFYLKRMRTPKRCSRALDESAASYPCFFLSQRSVLATLEAAADVQGAATSSGELYIPYRPLPNSCLHCAVCHIEFAP